MPETWTPIATQESVEALRADHTALRDQVIASIVPLMQDRLDKLAQTRDAILVQLAGASGQARITLQAAADAANQKISDVQTRIATLGQMQG